jgi:hypothetical protein
MWLDRLDSQQRGGFDAWLAGEPELPPAEDDRKTVLLQALGLS